MTTENDKHNPAADIGPADDTAVRLSDDIIVGLSLDGIITHISEAAQRHYGYTAEQLIGAPYTCLIPADRHREQQQILTLVASSQGAHLLRTVRQRANGEHFTVSVNAAPVFDPAQTPVGAVIIETDITARLRAEYDIRRVNELLTQLNARLSQAFKDHEAFTYSVSHDLREPLRAINGFSQALDEDYRDQLDDQAQHYLDRIRTAGKRMARLIDDILRLSRLSRQDLVLRELDLVEIARATVDQLRQQDPDREVELIIRSNMPACVDRRLITLALKNLLGNAWKYTSRTRDATIELGMQRQDDQSIYYITDNGCGIQQEQLDDIFLPFRRGRQADEYSGSGIGLAIVKRIVERHQGRIWCQSQHNQGATFYFTLDTREQD